MADVTFSGPIFTGTAEHIITAALDEGRREAIDEAEDILHRHTGVFRYESSPPTHQYVNRINKTHRGFVSSLVSGNLPYYHWIEGTGSRNATTRFKGYGIFKKTRNAFEPIAVEIINDHVRRAVSRLN